MKRAGSNSSPKQAPKQQAISNFFALESSKSVPTRLKQLAFKTSGSVYYYQSPSFTPHPLPSFPQTVNSSHPNFKLAAFDFDDTLARVNGTHTFPKTPSDYRIFHESVFSVLYALARSGFALVIFSNQKGILDKQNGDHRRVVFEGRVSRFVAGFEDYCICKSTAAKDGAEGIGLLVAAATSDDFYRKPRPGLMGWYMHKFALGQFVPSSSSRLDSALTNPCSADIFYCGDAAGRLSSHARKRDHSKSDMDFAFNCRTKFFYPETLFNDQNHQQLLELESDSKNGAIFELPAADFDFGEKAGVQTPLPLVAASVPAVAHPTTPANPNSSKLIAEIDFSRFDVIVLVGSPASGKSTFVRNVINNTPDDCTHAVISQDTLKTAARCITQAKQQLANGGRIVIDNTNPTRKARSAYLALHGRKLCVWIQTDKQTCIHNNSFRKIGNHVRDCLQIWMAAEDLGVEDSEPVPRVAIDSFWSKFEPPSLQEGFDELVHVVFEGQFEHNALRWIYNMVLESNFY